MADQFENASIMTAPTRPAFEPEDGKGLAIVPHDEGETQRIVLTGELDVATVPLFNKRLSELQQRGCTTVVLDLSGVTFMDSTGLSAILVVEMHARMRGQRFAVIEGPPHVNELFRLTGVDNFLEIISASGAARRSS
jgi:anti-sigma B factor antagonist